MKKKMLALLAAAMMIGAAPAMASPASAHDGGHYGYHGGYGRHLAAAATGAQSGRAYRPYCGRGCYDGRDGYYCGRGYDDGRNN